MLDIVASYHCTQFQRKLMKQTRETNKKPSFEANFGPFGLISSRHFFFFKNLAPSVTRYHGRLSSCTILEKNKDPILKKISDGRRDGQTDGETDESDFIGRCPTNA